MKFEWIRCKDKLPETPGAYDEMKDYYTVSVTKYGNIYQVMSYVDGWNCRRSIDGEIYKDSEITGVNAWAEIPEYSELDEVLIENGTVTEGEISLDGLEEDHD